MSPPIMTLAIFALELAFGLAFAALASRGDR